MVPEDLHIGQRGVFDEVQLVKDLDASLQHPQTGARKREEQEDGEREEGAQRDADIGEDPENLKIRAHRGAFLKDLRRTAQNARRVQNDRGETENDKGQLIEEKRGDDDGSRLSRLHAVFGEVVDLEGLPAGGQAA